MSKFLRKRVLLARRGGDYELRSVGWSSAPGPTYKCWLRIYVCARLVESSSLIENEIKLLFAGSKNRGILKQINKYEDLRADVERREHLARVLADWTELESVSETTTTIRKEEEGLRRERVRYEKLIDALVEKLELVRTQDGS